MKTQRMRAARTAPDKIRNGLLDDYAGLLRQITLRNSTARLWEALLFVVLVLCCGVPVAKADYAVLRSGQRLHITGWQQVNDTVRLDLEGGSITLPASELLSVEPEEVFVPVSPQQAPALRVPYGEQIQNAASKNGIDPMLVASIISVESNFNSRAISSKSAFGLMQLRPKTAANFSVRNLFDPQQNIDAGTRYLKELLDRYGQNLPLALAAYNAGPARVTQFRGIPPFQETHDYIRRVSERLRTQKIAASDTTPLWPLLPPR